ncbi:hypothetical protein ANRL1_01203 [Anaerolineae bacterium]|nr:hypothetical protein ANRL1_01203 [Anaerolineae bacterium]
MNRKTIGRVLIILGVSMWVPYLILKLAGAEVSSLPFLALHLCGVIPGAILTRGETLVRTIARLIGKSDDQSPA